MASQLLERVGGLASLALAPITASFSTARRARMFHPRGTLVFADVEAIASEAPWRAMADRLTGPAVVRFSSAWWKSREWKDVLGCAIRFTRSQELNASPEQGDQDLLFATIRRPWTMALAPLTTDQHDFFANDYYAVSPFDAGTGFDVEFRLVPERAGRGADREERLRRLVDSGEAQLALQARRYRRVIDLERREWQPIATVNLRRSIEADPPALHFDPFQSGRGLKPVGFIHALRLASYPASQRARGAHDES